MIYLIYGFTGDYYVPDELYAVCDNEDDAYKLYQECINHKTHYPNGRMIKTYEGAEVREYEVNKICD